MCGYWAFSRKRQFEVNMRFGFALFLFAISTIAYADGYSFNAGRFPDGGVTVFKLTSNQKQVIALFWKCRENQFSPYIFQLSPEQSEGLRGETGLEIERFAIFQSFAGDAGVDLDFNVINRFSEDEFEIPHKLLVSEPERQAWDRDVIGWAHNPLVNPTSEQLRSITCPIGFHKNGGR